MAPIHFRINMKLSRKIHFLWQRLTRGFDDSELWSLNTTVAAFIEPRLRAYIDTYNHGFPMGLDGGNEAWLVMLEKMHRAFKLIVDSEGAMYMLTEEEQAEVETGLNLFREHFFHLWD